MRVQQRRIDLILAPPGWGKTYQMLNLIQHSQALFVFIFPLRALCQEVYQAATKRGIQTFCLKDQASCKLCPEQTSQLIITTPELGLSMDFKDRIYILDEFHLFFYWGESFRESLLSFMESHLHRSPPLILLSATMSDELIQRTKSFFKASYEELHIRDLGNQSLKNMPTRVFYTPFKNWLVDESLYHRVTGCTLIFCRYRCEVKIWGEKLRRHGAKVITCVGGGALSFSEMIAEDPKWDFIVATSVVSHGVNLPDIRRLIISYPIDCLDIYLQMLGRGGREGGEFEVYTMNFNYFSKLQILRWGSLWGIKRLSHKYHSLLY